MLLAPGSDHSGFEAGWADQFNAQALWLSLSSRWFDIAVPDERDFRTFVTSRGIVPEYFNTNSLSWTDGNQGNDASLTVFTDRAELTADGAVTYVFGTNKRLNTIRYRGGYEQSLIYDANVRRSPVTDNLAGP